MRVQINAATRLKAAEVRLDKYVPDTEAHSKLPLPPGKWEQVRRNYMQTNMYEVASKGDKIAKVSDFYKKLGWQPRPAEVDGAWVTVRIKTNDPKLQLRLTYHPLRKETIIEFKFINRKS